MWHVLYCHTETWETHEKNMKNNEEHTTCFFHFHSVLASACYWLSLAFSSISHCAFIEPSSVKMGSEGRWGDGSSSHSEALRKKGQNMSVHSASFSDVLHFLSTLGCFSPRTFADRPTGWELRVYWGLVLNLHVTSCDGFLPWAAWAEVKASFIEVIPRQQESRG